MIMTMTAENLSGDHLGYLLHKNPANLHRASLSFGEGYVFFEETGEDRARVCLIVDADPLAMVQGRGDLGHADALYVNDRAYVPSSLLASAIIKFFGTALSGRCKERPDLVDKPLDLVVTLPSLAPRARVNLVARLFEPLGYAVERLSSTQQISDEAASEASGYGVKLSTTSTLRELLSQLVVLIPVLDYGGDHRWVDEADIEPFLRRVGSWLPDHPYASYIVMRAFKHQKHLIRSVIERYPSIEDSLARIPSAASEQWDDAQLEEMAQSPLSLNQQRFAAIESIIVSIHPSTLIDLGCGNGALIAYLAKKMRFDRLVGMDVSATVLERAKNRLANLQLSVAQQKSIEFLQGSLLYADPRIKSFDMALLIEVIEHVDPERLSALELQVFGLAAYQAIVVTTPNREFNRLYIGMSEHTRRHADHRFEWTREEFAGWASRMGETYGYDFEIDGIGSISPEVGQPTQLAIFRKKMGAKAR